MFKQYFEIGDMVEYAAPGEFSIIGTVTDIDRYFTDYDMVTIDYDGVAGVVLLVVSEYYCVRKDK